MIVIGRRKNEYSQFGAVDAPFLSWDFFLQNEVDTNVGSVRRSFTGFGREIFTDTGAGPFSKIDYGVLRISFFFVACVEQR